MSVGFKRNPSARHFWVVLITSALTSVMGAAGVNEVDFNRDIRPILVENCLACHGPDPSARKAGLRLDTRPGLFETSDERFPAVVPGNLDESELWYRVTTDEPDELMPPPESNKSLSVEQKTLLRQWITEGADWEGHWSFIPPTRPAVPAVDTSGERLQNPIDGFVAARLAANGLELNREADRRTLARRLALDLIGLPPSPEQVESFVVDDSPDYFENYVDELLDSEHWGEHRGRYWLDAARYADTHGLHFDNYREMWPYRDWVIDAFNRNLPYDEFVIEQLAGDLLENATEEQRVATGFQRCNITTNEGGTIEEENLALYANDRVTTTGWVFMGLTANCAACHDHKFDPFTQKDFYSLAAFYCNTTQSGLDKNWREGDGAIVVPQTAHDRKRWQGVPDELKTASMIEQLRALYVADTFRHWTNQLGDERFLSGRERAPLFGDEYVRVALSGSDGMKAGVVLAGGVFDVPVSTGIAWTNQGMLGAAPTMTKETYVDLETVSDIDQNEPLSFSAWVYLPKDFKGGGSIVAQMGGPEDDHLGWEFYVADKQFGVRLIDSWPNIALEARSENVLDFERWQLLTVTYSGGSRGADVTVYLDGRKVTTATGQNRLENSIRNRFNMRIGRRQVGNELNEVAIQDVRVYRRQLDADEVKALAVAPRLGVALADSALVAEKPVDPDIPDSASDEDKEKLEESYKAALAIWEKGEHARQSLRAYYELVEFAPTRLAALDRIALEAERDRIRARSPYTHVQTEKTDSAPVANILTRGQYDKVGEQVSADTPGFLPPMPEVAPRNRLGLAQWIVSPENPLTARVAVNRFWQELFGTGIVATTEDFGVVGDPPVNPELLDWLAVEFIESGWDIKHMYRLMVTSAAYRQDAAITTKKLERDRDNRLLSRGPRFRMDAEMVRDYALTVSGLLVPKVGGPSVKPYQPEGVWEAVAMPDSNTRFYEQDHGDALYRRSIYTFWKRAAPPATMDVFNAPSREVCSVRRERTNTPLQALATLNDPTFVEAARKLAERAMVESQHGLVEAIDVIASRVLLRGLTVDERTIVVRTWDQMRRYFELESDATMQFLQVGESPVNPDLAPAELAAYAMVANQLMNLDEVLNK